MISAALQSYDLFAFYFHFDQSQMFQRTIFSRLSRTNFYARSFFFSGLPFSIVVETQKAHSDNGIELCEGCKLANISGAYVDQLINHVLWNLHRKENNFWARASLANAGVYR